MELLYVFFVNVEVGVVFIVLGILVGVIFMNSVEFVDGECWIVVFKEDMKKIFRE